MNRDQSLVPEFSLPETNLEGLDENQQAAVQAVIPMLPTLVGQVFQLVNSSKRTEDQASAARASRKKVTQHAEEDPDEQKKFLVSPMVRQCLTFVLTL